MPDWVGVVLAAGKGQRMRSQIPKVLHRVCGRPMLEYSVEALGKAGIDDVVVVSAPQSAEEIRELFGQGVRYVEQAEPLGTGHALLQCAELLENKTSNVLVTIGDAPLVRSSTMKSLMAIYLEEGAAISLLTGRGSTQGEVGRVKRDSSGSVSAIVEASDDGYGDLVDEANAGVYCFRGSWLWPNLRGVKVSPTGEYYLTSLVGEAAGNMEKVNALVLDDPNEILGVNDRVQLALAESVLRQRIRDRWMRAGVTIVDPHSTFIDAGATLGQDTVIYPNTHIQGKTRIGKNCVIGPGTVIRDSIMGHGCKVLHSVIEESILEGDVDVGPYSHLRHGSYAEAQVHIGNFVEIKESRLGKGVKMGHFGYAGDAKIGANANLGAGLVTCNFDGANKHTTHIGEDAFIGSDTMLVAPVTVGKGAVTGAGTVVTKDVPPYRLAIGVPARIKERSP